MTSEPIISVLEELAALKQNISQLEDHKKALEETAVQMITALGQTSVVWEREAGSAKASLVQASTMKFDERGLEQALGPAIWEQVTKRVLDQKVLEDKVARGDIDISVVAQYSVETPKKPYVKITLPK